MRTISNVTGSNCKLISAWGYLSLCQITTYFIHVDAQTFTNRKTLI